jgi:hypothetical protein
MTAGAEMTGTLDHAVERLSRSLAHRLTRRSVVTRVGRYGIALSMGAAGVALLDPESAAAVLPCGCGKCRNPTTCGCNLSQWCGLGGDCPGGTCHCGGWTYSCHCTSGGQSGCWWYGDCCGECGSPSDCSCANSQCGSAPTCCNEPEWYTNAYCTQTCNCSSPWHIKCRRKYCNTSAGACGSPGSCCKCIPGSFRPGWVVA